jgi:NADP-reducing hydrogenase subunit HndD
MEQIRRGESPYTFIEIMACPGGCVNGGGQPQQPMSVRNFTDLRSERAKALYSEDAGSELRCSHQNPEIKAIYAEYFEKPGSHKAHEILHTGYVKRGL